MRDEVVSSNARDVVFGFVAGLSLREIQVDKAWPKRGVSKISSRASATRLEGGTRGCPCGARTSKGWSLTSLHSMQRGGTL